MHKGFNRAYRSLIIVMIILLLLDFWLNEFVVINLDGEYRDLVSWDGYAALFLPSAIFYYSFYVVQLMLLCGLLTRLRFARGAYVASVVVYTLFTPLYGVSVQLPIQSSISTLYTLSTGALVTMLLLRRRYVGTEIEA